MSISKRAFAHAAALVCAFNTSLAFAEDNVQAPPAPADEAPPAPAKPKAKPAAPAKPKRVPVQPSALAPVTPAQAAVTNDESARLAHVEAALEAAGGAPETGPLAEKHRQLAAEIARLDEQRQNLEAAVRGGLDPESVRPALADLRARSAELTRQLAEVEVQRAAERDALETPLARRLKAMEASIAQLDRTREPAKSPLATHSQEGETEPASTSPPTAKLPGATPTTPVGGWKDGFFLASSDGNYLLKISGFLDFKFAYQELKGAPDEYAFSIPLARAVLKGNLFSPAFKYVFIVDVGKGAVQLAYYFADYTFAPALTLRAGQQRRPFSRLAINSPELSQFVTPNATIRTFGDAIDLGIMLHNGHPTQGFEYAVGVFNGTGYKSNFTGDVTVDPATGKGTVQNGAFSNIPKRMRPELLARVGFNHGGIDAYTESDFEGGGFRAALAAASYVTFNSDHANKSAICATSDGVVKYHGFSSNAAVYICSRQAGTTFRDREYEAVGGSFEAGYMVTPRFEPVARYTVIDPKHVNNDTHMLTAGLNTYFYGHALKWQNDLGLLVLPRPTQTTTSYLIESQLQFVF